MKNLISKQREIIAIFIYALVVAGLFYLLVMPLIERIENKSNQIQEESLKQESARKHLAELPNIEQQYEKFQNGGGSVEMLLEKSNVVVLIEKLEKMAENTGNKITISVAQDSAVKQKISAKGKEAAGDSVVGELPNSNYLQMKIELIGEYGSIRNFIRSLENFEYFGDITVIRISKSDAASADVRAGSLFDGPAVSEADKPVEIQGNSLKASLDTVFYTK